MSFFTKLMGGSKGGAAATAAPVAKLLSEYTSEEIFADLQRRGYTINVNGKLLEATDTAPAPTETAAAQVVQERVLLTLEAIDKWVQQDRHRYDLSRNFDALWLSAWAFDWARTPPGYVCDANKSVKIGLGQYSSHEDPQSSQIVIIRHFDSERPGNYAKRNNWGDVPPVWAVAFSASELKELSQHAIAHYGAPYATLIHREPEGDIEPDEPWFVESHWLIEEGEGGVRKVGGIKVLAKCTQDKLPTTYIVRFKVRGSVFELKDTETILPAGDTWTTLDKPLPTPAEPVLPPADHLLPSATADAKPNEITGDCALEGRFHDGAEAETRNYEDYSDHLCQSLTTPMLTLTNPTDKRIAVTDFFVEFLSAAGEWVKGASPALGTQYTSYYGRKETQFADIKTFEVEPHSSVELVFQGVYELEKQGRPAYNGRPHNGRIHAAFPNPLHARVTLTDDKGATKVISFSHANAPLEDLWSTYDEVVQVSDKGEGFGPDFQADLWLCVENPLDLNKSIICVTTHKSDAHEWFVRVQSDQRSMSVGSYQSFDVAYLRKLAFKNSLKPAGEKQEEIDLEMSSSQNCKLFALVDLETNQIYALHGVIHIEHEGKTIAKQEAYVTLDFSRVTPKKE